MILSNLLESNFTTFNESFGLLDVTFMETSEIREEVFREMLLNAHFGNCLIEGVNTSERALIIRIRVTVFTIKDTRVLNYILFSFITLFAGIIATEQHKMRF